MSAVVNSYSQVKVSHLKETATERFQRQLNELKNRLREYHEHLDHIEEMYEETKVDIKRFKTKAGKQCKIVERDSAKEAQMILKVTQLNKELKRLKEKNAKNAVSLKVKGAPKATRTAANYTTAHQVMRSVKIGCVLALDSVAAS